MLNGTGLVRIATTGKVDRIGSAINHHVKGVMPLGIGRFDVNHLTREHPLAPLTGVRTCVSLTACNDLVFLGLKIVNMDANTASDSDDHQNTKDYSSPIIKNAVEVGSLEPFPQTWRQGRRQVGITICHVPILHTPSSTLQ